MFNWPTSTQLALLLVFGIVFVPVLLACIVGFFLSHSPHAGARARGKGKGRTESQPRSPDIAGEARAAIEQASQKLVKSAAECKYVFPWTLTAQDADQEIIFTRRYIFDSGRRDGLRVEEVVSTRAKALPRFPVAFRLVDRIGQDITWSIGAAGR